MSDNNNDRIRVSEPSGRICLRNLMGLCARKWRWFLVSLAICVGVAALYVARQEPKYERSEQILIKDQDTGGSIGDIANAFSSIGLVASNTNVYNELISFKSPAVMYEVARRLRLDMNYVAREGLRPLTLYGDNLPLTVEFSDIGMQEGASMKLALSPSGDVRMWKFRKNTSAGKEKFDGEVTIRKGAGSVKTPLGVVKIEANPSYKGKAPEEEMVINVGKMPMQTTVELYDEQLNGEIVDRDADVIELSMRDVSVQRCVDVLNTLLDVYNESWIEDKNKMALATSSFINERLRLIQEELGDVDSDIAKYQNETGSPDLLVSAEIDMKKNAELDKDLLMLTNQLEVARYVRQFIDDGANRNKLIPVNTGIDNPAIVADITAYNTLLLQRNSVMANSSEHNPLVQDYDAELKNLRESVEKSISNQVEGLEMLLRNSTMEKSKTRSKIASTPVQALPLLSGVRQQKVKESLYLFLLEKREENELGMKFTADNIRVLSPPLGSLKPVTPKTSLILVIAFIIGLLLPVLIIFIRESGNTRIRGKKDLEGVKMPFAGEIPQAGRKSARFRRVRAKEEKAPLSVVEEGKRDVVNEAFRVVRGNIDFMKGKSQECLVLMLTSFNPGSGKSFVAYNLGLGFAIKRKKVLLIDCDLRHGSASMYVESPAKGLSDYLSGHTDDWSSLVCDAGEKKDLQILPVGKLPPNPAELLENGRFARLIEEARKRYDYVIIDCPPVNIVVDTQIIAEYADRTLFVVRAGLLEKSALGELDEFYSEKKFRNMSLLLNGTEAVHSRYYTYGTYEGYGARR